MNLAIDSGGTASFSVAAIGTLPLSYQWYRDNMIIPNQTSSSITVGNGVQALPGTYSVVISNPAGSITNSAGVLTVNSSDVPLLSPLQLFRTKAYQRRSLLNRRLDMEPVVGIEPEVPM